jgi:Flp pilus assembly protein TadD
MRPGALTLLALLSTAIGARAARDDADEPRPPLSAAPKLIAELGSDEYAVRRRAEEQLIRMGPEAFDALKAAEDHDDLEIADRARYIVERMKVQWIQPDDPLEVRQLLARYGDLSESNRVERIAQLASLADERGLPAVCRIVRYDASPIVARRAALALVGRELPEGRREAIAAACRAALGGSQRPPAEWVELYLRELAEPRQALDAWQESIAAEAALLTARSLDTEFDIVRYLHQRHLDRCRDAELAPETTEALAHVVDFIAEQLARCRDSDDQSEARTTLYALYMWDVDYTETNPRTAGLAWALVWLINNKSWDALASFEDKFDEELKHNRKLLYYLAAATGRSGSDARAAELAEKAFELAADDLERRPRIAEDLAEFGYIEWAEREYRKAIAELPLIDRASMEARTDLAMWLHDREDYQGAADLLGEFCDAIDADPAARQRLIEEIDDETAMGSELVAGVMGRRLFYQACVDEARKDYDSQRKRLEEAAAAADNRDPDILIAMYRVPESDDSYRRRTRTRIMRASKYMQALIDESPEYPGGYNQWAWLIANTEGDQQRAVEYSKRSLELQPDEPSYLDTLGRCYYAVGDLENAVKSQRRAVELAPHYRVMQRQLALFERALAEKNAAK